MAKGRSGRPWRRLVEIIKREYPHYCHLCGGFIDVTLHYNDDMAFSVDHVVPLAENGDLAEEISNLRPAHRICNLLKGANPDYQSSKPKGSRVW